MDGASAFDCCSRSCDACCLEEYDPGHFDAVISKSVIGHLGSFERQKRMAAEIRRLGQRYFVQTPNHYFPVGWPATGVNKKKAGEYVFNSPADIIGDPCPGKGPGFGAG